MLELCIIDRQTVLGFVHVRNGLLMLMRLLHQSWQVRN